MAISSPGAETGLRALRGCALVALLAAPTLLAAQDRCSVESASGSCSVEITVHRSRATVMLVQLSDPEVVLPPPTLGPGGVTSQPSRGPVARVFSNARWQLQIAASQPAWRVEGGRGSPRKRSSDLGWSLSVSGPFAPLSTTAATIATGPPTRGTLVPLFFLVTIDPATDAPGEYALDLVVTLVAP